jgi:hypothetical protein
MVGPQSSKYMTSCDGRTDKQSRSGRRTEKTPTCNGAQVTFGPLGRYLVRGPGPGIGQQWREHKRRQRLDGPRPCA